MPKAVIVSAVRTPIGRYGGALRDVSAVDMTALVVREAIGRAAVDPTLVDEVIMGHVLVNGETPNVARLGWLTAGFPIEVPAYTLDRQCSSGLQAILNASMTIEAGQAEVVVAGGVESMSNGEYYVVGARWGLRMGSTQFLDRFDRQMITVSAPDACGPVSGMIGTAENIAKKHGITREMQDKFALRSQRAAIEAIEAGKFDEEIVPVSVPQKKGPPLQVRRDEHPRADATLESLGALRPIQGGTVTAGNASGMNDGAAACVLMSEERALAAGKQILGRIVSWAAAGVHPHYMGLGPVPAVRKALQKADLRLDQIDLIEINEAFSVQALGVLRELEVSDFERVNVNGSGVSLGHPIGATGARMMVTLLHEMKRRRARYGLNTMCIGGGQGLAAIVEGSRRA